MSFRRFRPDWGFYRRDNLTARIRYAVKTLRSLDSSLHNIPITKLNITTKRGSGMLGQLQKAIYALEGGSKLNNPFKPVAPIKFTRHTYNPKQRRVEKSK